MTQDEINALVELLNRLPMTMAERLWVSNLLQRLSQPDEKIEEVVED